MSEIALTPDQEAADAAALVDALEEKVRAGDEDVTPQEIEQARGLARFASLRADAATRKAAQARRDEAAAQVADAVAGAREFLDGVSAMQAARDELQAALTKWATSIRAQMDAGCQAGAQLEAANAHAESLGVPGSWESAKVRGDGSGIFLDAASSPVRRFYDAEQGHVASPTTVLRELCAAAGLALNGEVSWASRR